MKRILLNLAGRLTEAQAEKVMRIMSNRDVPISDICNMFNASRSVLYAEYKKGRRTKRPRGGRE